MKRTWLCALFALGACASPAQIEEAAYRHDQEAARLNAQGDYESAAKEREAAAKQREKAARRAVYSPNSFYYYY